jgi:hypothetical protein
MLKEFFDAVKTNQAQTVTLSNDGTSIAVVTADGKFQTHQVNAKLLLLAALDVRSLVLWLRSLEPFKTDRRVITITNSSIAAFVESGDGSSFGTRRVSHQMGLPTHPAFKLIEQHLETKAYTQRELVQMLRSKFSGFVDPLFVAMLRELDVKKNQQNKSNLNHGNASVAQHLVQEIRGKNGAEIPDQFIIGLPVHDAPVFRTYEFNVEMLLEIDAESDKPFLLTAVQNTVSEARYEALVLVKDFVEGELSEQNLDIPVLLGSVSLVD